MLCLSHTLLTTTNAIVAYFSCNSNLKVSCDNTPHSLEILNKRIETFCLKMYEIVIQTFMSIVILEKMVEDDW